MESITEGANASTRKFYHANDLETTPEVEQPASVAHEFTFAGTADELLEVVRAWRAWLDGEPGFSAVGLSRYRGAEGYSMGSRNPDRYTTKRLGDTERVYVGSVELTQDGGSIRRVSLSVSLLKLHPEESGTLMPTPEEWRYHPSYFVDISLLVRQQTGGVLVKMTFPKVVKEECEQLLRDIAEWAPGNVDTVSDNQAPAPASSAATADQVTPEIEIDSKTREMLDAVKGWPEAKQQRIRRSDYCHQHGIDESTLTKWRNKLRVQGYDVPDF